MSADGRTFVASILACAVLATTASAARAQMGSDEPHRCTQAVPDLSPSGPGSSSLLDLGSLRLGLPLSSGLSLAAYNWLSPAMSQMDARPVHVAGARRSTARSAWWWKRS